jgi:hypothetical protein
MTKIENWNPKPQTPNRNAELPERKGVLDSVKNLDGREYLSTYWLYVYMYTYTYINV